jgi:superfamily I DNA and RNA helicase
MKILNYIIPMSLTKNDFVLSLAKQAEKNGELTLRQEEALRDIIGIEEDYFYWDEICYVIEYEKEFNELREKLRRNRFRKTKTKNKCIRALISIIENKPRRWLIDEALGIYYRRYR